MRTGEDGESRDSQSTFGILLWVPSPSQSLINLSNLSFVHWVLLCRQNDLSNLHQQIHHLLLLQFFLGLSAQLLLSVVCRLTSGFDTEPAVYDRRVGKTEGGESDLRGSVDEL